LIGNTTGNTLTKTTLTAGSGITITNGSGAITIASSGGSGDVVGPASSTDNAIARFDSTTGKIIQNSVVTIADTTGNVAGVGALSTTGVISAVISGGTTNPGNSFWFSDNSASAMMYARQNGAGDLFALSAGATEQFRVTAAGVAQVASGVKFPATQSASADANTLDDYEEGTFAFTVRFGASNANNAGGTFTGYYAKIGRVVNIQASFQIPTKSVATGDLTITGLPFSVIDSSAVYIGGVFLMGFADYPSARIDSGTTIQFFETTNAGTRTTLTNSDCIDNFGFQFSSTYLT